MKPNEVNPKKSYIDAFADLPKTIDLRKHYAAEYGYEKLLDMPLSNQDIDEVIATAAHFGQKHIVEEMIASGAKQFNAAIVDAAGRGHLDIVKRMVGLGATYLPEALGEAASEGHLNVVEYLLPLVDPDNTDYVNILERAAQAGKISIIERILQELPPNSIEEYNAILFGSIFNNNEYLFRRAIELGADDYNDALVESSYT